jgi:hypothetical protein
LNILDEFSRECLAIKIDRKLNSTNVIDALTDLFIMRGSPAFIRSDNGPEFIAQAAREWIAAVGAKTAYIEPGSPWECGGRRKQCGVLFSRHMDTVRALMAGSKMNCSMERSSTAYEKHR